MLANVRRLFERLLEAAAIALMITMTVVVVVAVVYRKAGMSLSWYDEVASVLLAWLTYYGAALAALKRAHIGFDGVILAVPRAWQVVLIAASEAVVLGFFALLAWTGWVVLQVLEGDTLVSLPAVSVQITQSVMPIGAALFILCELLSLPEHWQRIMARRPHEAVETDGGEGAGR